MSLTVLYLPCLLHSGEARVALGSLPEFEVACREERLYLRAPRLPRTSLQGSYMPEIEWSCMPEGRICQSGSYMPEVVVSCGHERLHLRAPRLCEVRQSAERIRHI